MSNSEPSAIVLHGIACIGGFYTSFDSTGESASLQGSPRFIRTSQPGDTVPLMTPKQFYACVAGFPLKIPLNLSRYCRKTRIHNPQATSAGAMLPGAIVR